MQNISLSACRSNVLSVFRSIVLRTQPIDRSIEIFVQGSLCLRLGDFQVRIRVRVHGCRKFLWISILSLRSTKHLSRADIKVNSLNQNGTSTHPKPSSNCIQLAATRNVKAIRPLLDRVLVSRFKSEAVRPLCPSSPTDR